MSKIIFGIYPKFNIKDILHMFCQPGDKQDCKHWIFYTLERIFYGLIR